MALTPEELEKKLKDARDQDVKRYDTPRKPVIDSKATNMAFRVATELASSLAVGGFLGYSIDQWLGITPWAMIIFLFLGFIAGFMNLYRVAMGQEFKIGFKSDDDKADETNDKR